MGQRRGNRLWGSCCVGPYLGFFRSGHSRYGEGHNYVFLFYAGAQYALSTSPESPGVKTKHTLTTWNVEEDEEEEEQETLNEPCMGGLEIMKTFGSASRGVELPL